MAESDIADAKTLKKVMSDLTKTAVDVYNLFKFGQRFVNGIDEYIRIKKPGQGKAVFGEQWTALTDDYAILTWSSRDVCTDINFQLIEYINILSFCKNPDMPIAAKKAKVEGFLQRHDNTTQRAKDLCLAYKDLQQKVNEFKVNLDLEVDRLDIDPKDGSIYNMLMNDLKELKKFLPDSEKEKSAASDDFKALKKDAWQQDTVKPMTLNVVELEGAWAAVKHSVQLLLAAIAAAESAPTIIGLTTRLALAEQSFRELSDAIRVYSDTLHSSDLYWGYQNAIKRRP